MMKCWSEKEKERPNFSFIRQKLESMLESLVRFLFVFDALTWKSFKWRIPPKYTKIKKLLIFIFLKIIIILFIFLSFAPLINLRMRSQRTLIWTNMQMIRIWLLDRMMKFWMMTKSLMLTYTHINNIQKSCDMVANGCKPQRMQGCLSQISQTFTWYLCFYHAMTDANDF